LSADSIPNTPLRVGIIGLGFAGRASLETFAKNPEADVVALADVNSTQLAASGAVHHIANLYDDYRDLLAQEDVEAVVVATPNYLHTPVAIAALRAGKHVLCEKPLARTGVEAEQIVQTAIETARVLQVIFNHRARADVQTLKSYVDAGGLGRVYYAKAFWMRRAGIPGLGSWFTNKEMAGGGPLIDLGVHVLDMALHLLGEPDVATVSAATYSELGPRGRGGGSTYKMYVDSPYEVEDLATAFVRFVDGSTLTLETSWATYRRPNDEFGVALFGTEGGAEITVSNYVRDSTLHIYSDIVGLPTEQTPQLPHGDGYGRPKVVREFVEAVRSGDWSAHVGRDGLYRARIIDACYRSAREGREVPLLAPDV
jgi:predicted dehydrogenase